MPYMLDDFLALYNNKIKLIHEYTMPQDAIFYTNIELMNILVSWLKMCKKQGIIQKLKSKKKLREYVTYQKLKMQQCSYANEKIKMQLQ